MKRFITSVVCLLLMTTTPVKMDAGIAEAATTAGEIATILANFASTISILNEMNDKVETFKSDYQWLIDGTKKAVKAIQDLNVVYNCITEMYYFEQTLQNYCEYAANNMDFTNLNSVNNSVRIINQGLRYTKAILVEFDEIKDLLRNGDGNTPENYSMVQNFLKSIKTLRADFTSLVEKEAKKSLESDEGAVVFSQLLPGGSLCIATSMDVNEKGDLLKKNRSYPFSVDNRSQAKLLTGGLNGVGKVTITPLTEEEVSKKGSDVIRAFNNSSKNKLVNVVRILIGLLLLFYTVYNLYRYLKGSFENQFMNPLIRVALALIVAIVSLALIEALIGSAI